MDHFSIVVALDKNFGIGKDGDLPWHLSADLKHFKAITCDGSTEEKPNVVIMGRKTWESLPEKYRPLPNRLNVVLTRQSDYALPESVLKADSLESVSELLSSRRHNYIFIIGGAQLFESGVQNSLCQSLHITHIDAEFECDTFFPALPPQYAPQNPENWMDEGDIRYMFQIYKKV